MLASSEAPLWRQISLYLLTIGVLILCGLLLRPFVVAVVGAIVISVVTEKPYQWVLSRTHRPNLSATITLVLVILSIVVPIFFLAQDVGEQLTNLISGLQSERTQQHILDYLNEHPTLAQRIELITNNIDLHNAAQSTAAFLGKHFASLIGRSIGAITQIVAMLFILFFLYRDRALAGRFARSLLPLREREATVFLERMRGTVYATALGRLAIAGLQGVLAGAAYWALGVPNALLWAILTGTMAMVPAFGAFLVWVPVALYLGFSGHWIKAAGLAFWGGGVVSLVDNFLYPIMVGPQLRQHTVVVLLSILGGISLFGITGIVLGPLAFTAAATLLDIWRTRDRANARNTGAEA
ncbi:MAG TPA: AI-2E family transporter [Edaphobacter sp.]|nr:AI-2E family transporter [Edaphobacter sp.]